MKLKDYLAAKYPSKRIGLTGAEQRAFGIEMRRGWVAKYADMEITDDMQALLVAKVHTRSRRADLKSLEVLEVPPWEGEKLFAKAKEKRIKKAIKVKALERKLVLAKKPHHIPAMDMVSDAFLSTYEWRRVRMEALKKYGARCMCCGASPAEGAVMNVDHVKPRRLFPQLALDVDNLQILCSPCNHGKGNWDMTDWRPEEIDKEAMAHLRAIMNES